MAQTVGLYRESSCRICLVLVIEFWTLVIFFWNSNCFMVVTGQCIGEILF